MSTIICVDIETDAVHGTIHNGRNCFKDSLMMFWGYARDVYVIANMSLGKASLELGVENANLTTGAQRRKRNRLRRFFIKTNFLQCRQYRGNKWPRRRKIRRAKHAIERWMWDRRHETTTFIICDDDRRLFAIHHCRVFVRTRCVQQLNVGSNRGHLTAAVVYAVQISVIDRFPYQICIKQTA